MLRIRYGKPWLAWLVLQLMSATTHSFLMTQPTRPIMTEQRRPLFYSNDGKGGKGKDGDSSNNEEVFDVDVLQKRLLQARVQVLEEELLQPPNPDLSPREFIRHVLLALWDSSNPLPDSGFRVLLRSSTRRWRDSLYHSVGAPNGTKEEAVASALGEAMVRPNNQFAILINADGDEEDELPPYIIDFPSEVVDYGDGTCWVECRLLSRRNRSLDVAMGWQLHQRACDGAWLVDQIDWQDFRDKFRPGIGREEWIRICG